MGESGLVAGIRLDAHARAPGLPCSLFLPRDVLSAVCCLKRLPPILLVRFSGLSLEYRGTVSPAPASALPLKAFVLTRNSPAGDKYNHTGKVQSLGIL